MIASDIVKNIIMRISHFEQLHYEKIERKELRGSRAGPKIMGKL
jgi:hypothetical protein